MDLEEYYNWLPLARKFSRTPNDAQDLLQESLLVAFEQERLDFTIEQNRKWFTGVLKNRAAMMARSESRRKNREQSSAIQEMLAAHSFPEVGPYAEAHSRLLNEFKPAARRVVALILLGLNREEICSVLNISSVALRQRLTTIRKALKNLPQDLQREALALAYQRRTDRAEDLAFGLIRRALQRLLRHAPGIGMHDPDGHLLVINPQ